MDRIWTPWRMEFIEGKRYREEEGPCVFCELKEKNPDSENLVLYRGEKNYVVMNRFPYTNGHLLIIPYVHLAHLKDFEAEGYREILELMAQSMEILKTVLKAEGFNCGLNVGRVSGCGILNHFHWHVVPRWSGDTNFLPVLSDVRQMPEYLSETYKRLRAGFQKLGRES